MVGDILGGRPRRQDRIAKQVPPWQHDVTHVNGVLRDKAMAPIIHGQPKLRGTGFGFKESAIQAKAKISAQNGDRRWLIGRRREHVPPWERDVAPLAVVGGINPVVDTKPEIRDAALGIDQRKSSKEHFAHISLAIAVGILQVQNVRRSRDDQSPLPGEHAGHLQEIVGKYH